VLLAPGDNFLPFPGRFVANRVFGQLRTHPGFEPRDFQNWSAVLLNAANKKQLVDGEVDLAGLSKDGTFGFNFDVIITPHEAGITEHVRIYEGIRSRKEKCPSPEQLANAFLVANGISVTVENRRTILERIDAALTLAAYLCNLAHTSNYKFENHRGDWVDGQHLYYLAEPTLYITTMDNPLKARINGSPQANRVVSFEELLRL